MTQTDQEVRGQAGRRERSRRELAAVAVGQFSTKGFAATTVEEIADAAGYNPRTFFRHFESKEDAVFFDLPDILDPIETFLAVDDPPAAWAGVCAVLVDNATRWGEEGPTRTRLIHEEPALYRRFLEIAYEWEVVIARVFGAERGVEAEADTYCQVLAAATVGACLTSMRVWLVKGGTLVEHFAEGLDLIERGFGLPPRATA